MRHIFDNDSSHQIYYLPYPVQMSIPYFPDNIKYKCMQELTTSTHDNISISNKSFADYTLNYFGKTLVDIFIRPYNKKVCKNVLYV